MRYGVSLLRVSPALWVDVAREAEQLGFESVWMSDHLVLPADLSAAGYPDGELPIRPTTPTYDVMVFLAAIAASTTGLRLGTYVYQLGLRHPFVAARSVATLDVVSAGRVELGVGAGWLRDEWAAAGLDFGSRGRRLDEALDVCRRLWSEAVVEHAGEHFAFPPVAFEPKPVQRPHPPLHIGGESTTVLRRAASVGDGWIGMHHTPQSVQGVLAKVADAAAQHGRQTPLERTVAAHPGAVADIEAWRQTGVDRLLVAPWRRSAEALAGLRTFARDHLA